MIFDIVYLMLTVGYSSVGPGWSDGRGGGKGRSGMSLLQLGKICFVKIDFSNATTYIINRFSFFKLDFHLFLFVVWVYGCFAQICVAEAGFCFSQEIFMDVVPADVVTGICVALADYLKIKLLQLED